MPTPRMLAYGLDATDVCHPLLVDANGQLLVSLDASPPSSVDVTNGAGAAAVNIQDGGNAITVDALTWPLPTGAATAAKQDEATALLGSIDGKITAVDTGAVVVASSALPSGAASAAKQPALGTAGTPATDVLSVQGIVSMTALKTDGSAVTQPVSDAAGSLTVDAPVGTPVAGRISDGAAFLATPNASLLVTATRGFDGAARGSKPVYVVRIPSQVHVNTANTVHWDLFNAHATLLVRVVSILQVPNITTAVTGIVFDWLLERTTSVGTGGSALTPWLPDLSQTALNGAITARSKPSGGAAQDVDLVNYSLSSEETNAATQLWAMLAQGGMLDLVPNVLRASEGGILLRQDQGIRCVQVTQSAAGNTGWLIAFTVE